MDGMTGLDISRAKNDIINFQSQASRADGIYDAACQEFLGVLYDHWASPVAKEVSGNYALEMGTLENEFYMGYTHVINGAIDAATILASANGATFSGVDKYPYDPGETGDMLVEYNRSCEEDKNGTVGMAVDTVKIALDVLVSKLNNVISLVEALPKYISFYSPDGAMLNAYSTHVEEFAGKITELRDSLVKSMTSCMETEINNIIMAKQQATETLSA